MSDLADRLERERQERWPIDAEEAPPQYHEAEAALTEAIAWIRANERFSDSVEKKLVAETLALRQVIELMRDSLKESLRLMVLDDPALTLDGHTAITLLYAALAAAEEALQNAPRP